MQQHWGGVSQEEEGSMEGFFLHPVWLDYVDQRRSSEGFFDYFVWMGSKKNSDRPALFAYPTRILLLTHHVFFIHAHTAIVTEAKTVEEHLGTF